MDVAVLYLLATYVAQQAVRENFLINPALSWVAHVHCQWALQKSSSYCTSAWERPQRRPIVKGTVLEEGREGAWTLVSSPKTVCCLYVKYHWI